MNKEEDNADNPEACVPSAKATWRLGPSQHWSNTHGSHRDAAQVAGPSVSCAPLQTGLLVGQSTQTD